MEEYSGTHYVPLRRYIIIVIWSDLRHVIDYQLFCRSDIQIQPKTTAEKLNPAGLMFDHIMKKARCDFLIEFFGLFIILWVESGERLQSCAVFQKLVMNRGPLSERMVLGIPCGRIQGFRMTKMIYGDVVFDIFTACVSLMYRSVMMMYGLSFPRWGTKQFQYKFGDWSDWRKTFLLRMIFAGAILGLGAVASFLYVSGYATCHR